jgi:hypothetical protein
MFCNLKFAHWLRARRIQNLYLSRVHLKDTLWNAVQQSFQNCRCTAPLRRCSHAANRLHYDVERQGNRLYIREGSRGGGGGNLCKLLEAVL